MRITQCGTLKHRGAYPTIGGFRKFSNRTADSQCRQAPKSNDGISFLDSVAELVGDVLGRVTALRLRHQQVYAAVIVAAAHLDLGQGDAGADLLCFWRGHLDNMLGHIEAASGNAPCSGFPAAAAGSLSPAQLTTVSPTFKPCPFVA